MASTKGPPSEDAIIARIITHMNAEHQDSLVRYLEHYCALSSFSARNARMTEMSKTALTLTTASPRASPAEVQASTYTIPIDPPLANWSEARPRVIAMDETCITALKRSPVTLKTYLRPRGLHAAILAGCVFIILLLHRRSALLPIAPESSSLVSSLSTASTSPYDSMLPWPYLAARFPSLFAWLHKNQPWLLYPLLAAHAGEATFMGAYVLRKYSVPVGSPLWRTWVLGCFLEGFGTFERIKAWATAEKARREKASH